MKKVYAKKNTFFNNNGYNFNGNYNRTVVETYSNGTNWYRVWSDGWIEQGGRVTITGASGFITLLKPFRDNNYTPTGQMEISCSQYENMGMRADSKNQIYVYTYFSRTVNWRAEGYAGA